MPDIEQSKDRTPEKHQPETGSWLDEAVQQSQQQTNKPAPSADRSGILELSNPFTSTNDTTNGSGDGSSGSGKSASISVETKSAKIADFGKWLKTNFADMDSDSDGKLTVSEVEKRMLDQTHGNGPDAAKLAALHQNLWDIAYSVKTDRLNEQGLIMLADPQETAEVLKDDVDKFANLTENQNILKDAQRQLALSELVSNFDKLNSPEDPNTSQLTPSEVDTALKATDLSDTQRQALQDLKKHQEHLLTKSYKTSYTDENGKEWVSDDDIGAGFATYKQRQYAANLDKAEISALAPAEARVLNGLHESLNSAERRLDDAKKPENKNRISQGTDGSCFFLAPLIALQKQDSAAVDRMIKDNKDGTYTVTLPGAPDSPIKVAKPTDAEMANWANGERAAIFERALGEHYDKLYPPQKNEYGEVSEPPKPSLIPSARIQGGHTEDAWKLLTGQDPKAFEFEGNSEEDIRVCLKSVQDKPLTADTVGYADTRIGLVGRHSYSIKYDSKTDSIIFENPVKPISARDNNSNYPHEPHKLNGEPVDGKNDGIFSMPLAQAWKHLARVVHP